MTAICHMLEGDGVKCKVAQRRKNEGQAKMKDYLRD